MLKKWIMGAFLLSFLALLMFSFLSGGTLSATWGHSKFFIRLDFAAFVLVTVNVLIIWLVFKAGRVRQWWTMRSQKTHDKNLTLAALMHNVPAQYHDLFSAALTGSTASLMKYISQKRFDAVVSATEPRSLKPEERATWYLLKAYAAQQLHNTKMRLDFLIKAVNMNKSDALVLLALWECLYEMNACEQALSILFRIRKTRYFPKQRCDGWEAVTLVRRADASEDAYKAFIDYQKASVLDPLCVAARLGVFDALTRMNKQKQARQHIEAAWFYVQHPELARRYLESLSPQDALMAAQRLASFAPEALESTHVVAQALLNTNNDHQCEQLLMSVPLEHWSEKTHFLALELYARQGNREKVTQLTRNGLQLR